MDPRKASASRAASASILLRGGVAEGSRPRDQRAERYGVGHGLRLRAASVAAAISSASSAEGVARAQSSTSMEVSSLCVPEADLRSGQSSLVDGGRVLDEGRSRGGPPPRTIDRSSWARSALRLTTSLPSKPIRPRMGFLMDRKRVGGS